MTSPFTRNQTMILKVAAPVVIVAIVLSAIGALLLSNASSTQAAATYQQRRHTLDASLRTASQQGYSSQDLAPITDRLRQMDSAREPWWFGGRTAFYEHQASEVSRLQGDLGAL